MYLEGQLSEPFTVTTGVLQGNVLAPFLFIIVKDYVSRLSARILGYLTHKGPPSSSNTRPQCGTAIAKESRAECKRDDLAYANDISLLEDDLTRAQQQLTQVQQKAGTVWLQLNEKTVQVQMNASIDNEQLDEFK